MWMEENTLTIQNKKQLKIYNVIPDFKNCFSHFLTVSLCTSKIERYGVELKELPKCKATMLGFPAWYGVTLGEPMYCTILCHFGKAIRNMFKVIKRRAEGLTTLKYSLES